MASNKTSEEKPRAKPKHRKGLWSPEEDQKLRNYILRHGHGCWSSVPIKAGLQRNGKSCRLRWINYLRPGLKRGMFSKQEEDTILTLHRYLGNKWSQIALNLPGRTDNEIKNYWHSYLRKKVQKMEEMEAQNKALIEHAAAMHESSSSVDTDQSAPQMFQRSPLPKLIFAEWLSVDIFSTLAAADSLPYNHKTATTFDNINSSLQENNNLVHGYLLNDQGLTYNNNQYYHHNSMNINGLTGDMYNNTQFKFEEQSHQGNYHFGDFGSTGVVDICSAGFNMNSTNGVMFP